MPLAAMLYASALALASLLPSGAARAGGWDEALTPSVQNILHVPAYALLFLLALWCIPQSLRLRSVMMLIMALSCGAFGAVLELAQALVPGRIGSPSDVLLNFAGALVGLSSALLYRHAGHCATVPVQKMP